MHETPQIMQKDVMEQWNSKVDMSLNSDYLLTCSLHFLVKSLLYHPLDANQRGGTNTFCVFKDCSSLEKVLLNAPVY